MKIDHDSHTPDLGHYTLTDAIEVRRIRKGVARPSNGSGLNALLVLAIGCVIALGAAWPTLKSMNGFAAAERAIDDVSNGRMP